VRELVGEILEIESGGDKRARRQHNNPRTENQPPINHRTGANTVSATVNRIHVNTHADEFARVRPGACAKGLSLIAVVYTIANQKLALLITVYCRTASHMSACGRSVGCCTEVVAYGGSDQGARHRHRCISSSPGKVVADQAANDTPGNRTRISVMTGICASDRFCPAFVDGTCDLNRFVQRFRLDDLRSIDVPRDHRRGG
jgi:hypothetical protein